MLLLAAVVCPQVTLGNETRLVQLTASAGYGDLLSQVAAKFPNAGVCGACGGVAQAVEERQIAAFRPRHRCFFHQRAEADIPGKYSSLLAPDRAHVRMCCMPALSGPVLLLH